LIDMKGTMWCSIILGREERPSRNAHLCSIVGP
jgi:hypothetical protein